jgi:hypothetical protein
VSQSVASSLTVPAKVRPLKRGDLKVTCGRAHPCPTILGTAGNAKAKGMTMAEALASSARDQTGEQPVRRWTLYAPEPFLGYYRDQDEEETAYRLIKPKAKVDHSGKLVTHRLGRAALPEGLQSLSSVQAGGRGIVGEFPSLPAVVICPHCGTRNVVEVPQGALD